MKHETDEKIKNLNEENKKLREEIKYMKEENIIKTQEILNLKQEVQVIKKSIEKPKNNEIKPIWTKRFSFRHEKEKRKKLEIIGKDIYNIISENELKNERDTFLEINNYYKIEIFDQKENSIGQQKGGKVKIRDRQNSHRQVFDRNFNENKLNLKSLKNILEESDNINSFQERLQTDFNKKEDDDIKSNEKALIKKENSIKKINKINAIKRLNNFNTNTKKLTRNNSRQFITPTKLNNRRFSFHSENI